MTPIRLLVAALAGLLLSGCMTFTSKLGLVNDTTHILTPYPVVLSPAPPHRAPVGMIPLGHRVNIDTTGFNPLYYAPGVTDPSLPNVIYIGLDLYDAEPPQLLYRLYHYPVAPDQLDSNPAHQPVLLGELLRDLADVDTEVVVTEVLPGGIGATPPGTWEVSFEGKP